jgi:hypothetical protein
MAVNTADMQIAENLKKLQMKAFMWLSAMGVIEWKAFLGYVNKFSNKSSANGNRSL